MIPPAAARSRLLGACVLCDEPLEYKLFQERIVNLGCAGAHVAHGNCLLEEFGIGHDASLPALKCPACDGLVTLDTNVLESSAGSLSPTTSQPRGSSSSRTSTVLSVTSSKGSDGGSMPNESGSQSPRSARSNSTHSAYNATSPSLLEQTVAAMLPLPPLPPLSRLPRLPANTRILEPVISVSASESTVLRSADERTLTCLLRVQVPQFENLQGLQHQQLQLQLHSSAYLPLTSPVDRAMQDLVERLDRSSKFRNFDLSKFGRLSLWGVYAVKYAEFSRKLHCYLFEDHLICFKNNSSHEQGFRTLRPTSPNSPTPLQDKGGFELRTCVNLRQQLISTFEPKSGDACSLVLRFADRSAAEMTILFPEEHEKSKWHAALNDMSDERKNFEIANTIALPPPPPPPPPRSSSILHRQAPLHIPVDLIVAVPVTSICHGSASLAAIQETLQFLVQSLGINDKLGVVVYSSMQSSTLTVAGLKARAWPGWQSVISQLPSFYKSGSHAVPMRGFILAMSILGARTHRNPIARTFLINDTADKISEFPMSPNDEVLHPDTFSEIYREALLSSIGVHSFGVGPAHEPEELLKIGTATRGTYTFVDEWNGLREAVAGGLGICFALSHRDVKIMLRIPEKCDARITKVEGGISHILVANDRQAEISIGELAFGDCKDIVVHLNIAPFRPSPSQRVRDNWDIFLADMHPIGMDDENQNLFPTSFTLSPKKLQHRPGSTLQETVLHSSLTYLQFATSSNSFKRHLAKQDAELSVLFVTELPETGDMKKPSLLSVLQFQNPELTQRRLEIVVAECLKRMMKLVQSGYVDLAVDSIHKTQNIIQGLARGALPPPPPLSPMSTKLQYSDEEMVPIARLSLRNSSTGSSTGSPPGSPVSWRTTTMTTASVSTVITAPPLTRASSPALSIPSPTKPLNIRPISPKSTQVPQPPLLFPPQPSGRDAMNRGVIMALDRELQLFATCLTEPGLERFNAKERKRVWQVIDMILRQRSCTLATPLEALYASRTESVRVMISQARENV
ncbi:uncharacterized protein V1518DRAFT_6415 [Limtongia smithiae]|uniref:uncharacterized protein n=1 Tax=Limtongia smithiae TaxID=1125753 RepID=UPI0034CE6D61